jgi:hypothetical protein
MGSSGKNAGYLRMKAAQFRQLAGEHWDDLMAHKLLQLAADLEILAAETERGREAP